MAKTPEGIVKADVEDWLVYQGFVKAGRLSDEVSESDWFKGTYYMPVPHPFQVAGIADFVLCVKPNGHTLWIEAKAKNGKLSGPQEDRHAEIRASGGTVWTVYSLDELIMLAVESQLFDVVPYQRARRSK